MKEFNKHIKTILKFEGGYVNDPIDSGGETKYGISKRAYPLLDIESLTLSEAKQIYYKDYWIKANCQWLPIYLQLMHFDTSINLGYKRATIILQKASGAIVDGYFGPETRTKSVNCTLAQYATERCLFYAKIVKARPNQLRFLVGWNKRVKIITHE